VNEPKFPKDMDDDVNPEIEQRIFDELFSNDTSQEEKDVYDLGWDAWPYTNEDV
jgi:hypothetical protein